MQINIVDTLDYTDITIEVKLEKALCYVDGAILVLSGVLGVQKGAKIIEQHMKGYEIPRLVFIDKLEQKGANSWEVLNQVS